MKTITGFDFLEIFPPSSGELKAKLTQIIENSEKLSVGIKQLNGKTGSFEIKLQGVFKEEDHKA